jgi:hypothetical protein
VIADLSVNHVERYVLLCGHAAFRVEPDYGYDLVMTTYNDRGEVEPGFACFQMKATDHLPLLQDGKTISWTISRRDLKLWLSELFPVILVVYDGQRDKAYWLAVQEYFSGGRTADVFAAGEWINLRVPARNRINRQAVERIAQHKRQIHQQLLGRENLHG